MVALLNPDCANLPKPLVQYCMLYTATNSQLLTILLNPKLPLQISLKCSINSIWDSYRKENVLEFVNCKSIPITVSAAFHSVKKKVALKNIKIRLNQSSIFTVTNWNGYIQAVGSLNTYIYFRMNILAFTMYVYRDDSKTDSRKKTALEN
jgi:hypothetical protein